MSIGDEGIIFMKIALWLVFALLGFLVLWFMWLAYTNFLTPAGLPSLTFWQFFLLKLILAPTTFNFGGNKK